MNSRPNLLPFPILVQRSRQRRIARWAVMISFEAVVLTVACLYTRVSTHDQVSMPKEAIASTVAQIDLITAAIAEAESELSGVQQKIAVANTVRMRPEWSIVMGVVARAGSEQILLETCQLFPGAGVASGKEEGEADEEPAQMVYRFTFVGVSDSQDGVTQFVGRLKGSGVFDTAQVIETRRAGEGPNKGAVRFTVDASLIEGNSP